MGPLNKQKVPHTKKHTLSKMGEKELPIFETKKQISERPMIKVI